MIWGGADVAIIEVKCTINLMSVTHPETILPPPQPVHDTKALPGANNVGDLWFTVNAGRTSECSQCFATWGSTSEPGKLLTKKEVFFLATEVSLFQHAMFCNQKGETAHPQRGFYGAPRKLPLGSSPGPVAPALPLSLPQIEVGNWVNQNSCFSFPCLILSP